MYNHVKKSLFFMKYSIQSNFIYQYLCCTKLVDPQGASQRMKEVNHFDSFTKLVITQIL